MNRYEKMDEVKGTFTSGIYLQRMSEVLDYIERHLSQEIIQSELAKRAACSFDNLGRIFSYVSGQSFVDYIRGRRLTCAAIDMINGDVTIPETALKYGYRSHNSFTKAFQRHHGILPSEVKIRPGDLKLCPRLILSEYSDYSEYKQSNTKQYSGIPKGGHMEIGYLESHMRCSIEEKGNCMEIVNEMLRLQNITIKYGILELENEIRSNSQLNQYPLLVKGIELIADGIDPSYVKEVLKNYIIADGSTGSEFLKNIIIMEGILEIQGGCNSWLYKEVLKSYFGMEFSEIFDEKCMFKDKRIYSDTINKDKPSYSEKTVLLEKYIHVNLRSIQRLLRELDPIVLSKALYGVSGKILSYFMQNVSGRTRAIVMEMMSDIKPPEDEIVKSQKSVNEIAVQLEKQGDIIL